MKFIIFDIDGTLTNTKSVDDVCFIQAFQETFNIDISNQKWETLKNITDWGITEEIIEREWGRLPTPQEYDAMHHNHINLLQKARQKNPNQFNEVEGARTFFYELLKKEDVALGVATGAWEASAKLKLDAAGIALDAICFSNSDYHKSREAITKDVIEQLTQNNPYPETIIYFGDGVWDFNCCQNLDIQFIGIDVEDNGKLKALGAKTVFRNYSDPQAILKVIF